MAIYLLFNGVYLAVPHKNRYFGFPCLLCHAAVSAGIQRGSVFSKYKNSKVKFMHDQH